MKVRNIEDIEPERDSLVRNELCVAYAEIEHGVTRSVRCVRIVRWPVGHVVDVCRKRQSLNGRNMMFDQTVHDELRQDQDSSAVGLRRACIVESRVDECHPAE